MHVNVFADGVIVYVHEDTATFLAHADRTKTYFQMVLDVTHNPNETMGGPVEKRWFYEDSRWSKKTLRAKHLMRYAKRSIVK